MKQTGGKRLLSGNMKPEAEQGTATTTTTTKVSFETKMFFDLSQIKFFFQDHDKTMHVFDTNSLFREDRNFSIEPLELPSSNDSKSYKITFNRKHSGTGEKKTELLHTNPKLHESLLLHVVLRAFPLFGNKLVTFRNWLNNTGIPVILNNTVEPMEKLGEGGEGTVYKCKYNGEECAMKVLGEVHGNMDTSFTYQNMEHYLNSGSQKTIFGPKEGLYRELRCLFSTELNHLNIIRGKGIIIIFHSNFFELKIIMEYCNSDLKKYIEAAQQRGESPDSTDLDIAIQICKGLQQMHNHNYIHRDIKPGNILLNKMNVPKICDFGISKHLEEEEEEEEETAERPRSHTANIGTSFSRAPELDAYDTEQGYQESTDYYGKKADIYSLGITLCSLFTRNLYPIKESGRQATHGQEFMQMRKSGFNIPEYIPVEESNLNNIIRHLIEKCWKKAPTERPDIAEVIQELEQIRQTPPPQGGGGG